MHTYPLAMLGVIGLGLAACVQAGQPPAYVCPASVRDGPATHALAHISVFDGPPEQLAALKPDDAKGGAIWRDLAASDVYLGCYYPDADKQVIVHAPGVKACVEKDQPLSLRCR